MSDPTAGRLVAINNPVEEAEYVSGPEHYQTRDARLGADSASVPAEMPTLEIAHRRVHDQLDADPR